MSRYAFDAVSPTPPPRPRYVCQCGAPAVWMAQLVTTDDRVTLQAEAMCEEHLDPAETLRRELLSMPLGAAHLVLRRVGV